MTQFQEKLWRLLILLSAAVLRLWDLSRVPPGLTHDEADHGLSAWEVLQGRWSIYFSVGYGREPLYDYVTAALMALTRPSFLIGRLTAVFFSLLLLAAVYALIKRLTSPRIALLTIAGLAVGFWPLMASRQALRSITLPFFLVMAVYFWLRHSFANTHYPSPNTQYLSPTTQHPTPPSHVLLSALFLGLSFYTYLASRIMWLIFPGMLLFWFFTHKERFQAMWRPTLMILLLAGVISSPLWVYLQQNPGAEQRLGQLTQTLDDAQNGNLQPLATTIMEGVRLIPFRGDTAWRYNIPDRPLLAPLMALLWALGIGLILARIFARQRFGEREGPIWRANVSAEMGSLALGWLLLGLGPVFITGRFLANTQVIGLMPILYFFPAVGIDWMLDRSDSRSPFARAAVGFLFLAIAFDTVQSYFVTWGQHPEVRIQYETPLFNLLDELNRSGRGAIAISNPTPGRYHSQPLGLVTLHNPEVSLRWFDGRSALYIPAGAGESTLVFPADGSAPAPALFPLLEPSVNQTTNRLNPADPADDVIQIAIDSDLWAANASQNFSVPDQSLLFDGRIALQGVILPEQPVQPEMQIDVITWWLVEQAADVDLVLFTQILGPDGLPLNQIDRLDAPANAWVSGDYVIQLHELTLPANTAAGEYEIITGFYFPDNGVRLPLTIDGEIVGQDYWRLGIVTVE